MEQFNDSLEAEKQRQIRAERVERLMTIHKKRKRKWYVRVFYFLWRRDNRA